MQPLSLGADDHDELEGPFDCAEPVRRPRRELDRLSRFDNEGLVAQQQPQAAIEDVERSR